MKTPILALAVVFLTGIGVSSQTAGGGRAVVEAPRNESTIRRRTRPAVARTAPKRIVPRAKTAAAWEAEGDKLYDAKDHDSALVAYESGAKLKPTLRSLYRIGWIRNEFKEYDKALTALNQALLIDPNSSSVYLEKGYAHRRLNQSDAALAALKKSLSLSPNSHIAHFELGSLYNDLKMYREASVSLNQSIAIKSDNAEAYEELGVAQRRLGQNQEALASFRRSVQLDPADAGAYMGMGDVFFYGTKQYIEAVDNYLKGLQYDADNHIAMYNIAWSYNELKNYNEALYWTGKTVGVKPDYYLAYSETGYAQSKLGRTNEAVAAYQKALQYKPDHANSLFGIGDVYYDNAKNYTLALDYYKKGLAVEPNNQAALYRSGWCHNHAGQYQAAVDVLNRALRLDSSKAHFHREIGYSYWQLNRTADAIGSLRQSIALNRDDAVAHYYLGQLYFRQGNRSGAMNAYRELQRLKSEYAAKLMNMMNEG